MHLVSFTFGCPTSEIVERLHRADMQVAATVTTVSDGTLLDAIAAVEVALPSRDGDRDRQSALHLERMPRWCSQ